MASRTGAFSTSVGTKLLIGITGLALFIYLLIHIAGNLLVFLGPTVFNRYAYVMEVGNPLLPLIEIGLLLVFLLHQLEVAVTLQIVPNTLLDEIAQRLQHTLA